MNKKILACFFALTILSLSTLGWVLPAKAQGAALSVSPIVSELSLSPGANTSIAYQVTNNSNNAVDVTVNYYDFDPTGTSGEPDLLLDGKSSEYGLKDWFDPSGEFALAAGETKSVNITLVVPSGVASKSYRGAVLFKTVQTSGGTEAAQSIGALVLVNIGEVAPDADFPALSVDKIELREGGLDADFSVSVKNTSDYAFKPEIKIEIFDASNNVVATVSPSDVGNVLPQSTRVYVVPFSSLVSTTDGLKARATITLPDRGKTIIESNEVEVTDAKAATAEEVQDLKEDAESVVTTVRLVGAIFFVLVVVATAIILLTVRKRSRREAAMSAQIVTTPYSAPAQYAPPTQQDAATTPPTVVPTAAPSSEDTPSTQPPQQLPPQ